LIANKPRHIAGEQIKTSNNFRSTLRVFTLLTLDITASGKNDENFTLLTRYYYVAVVCRRTSCSLIRPTDFLNTLRVFSVTHSARIYMQMLLHNYSGKF